MNTTFYKTLKEFLKKINIKEKLKNLCRKENLLVIGLVGAILLVISWPTGQKDTDVAKKTEKVTVEKNEVTDKESMERKLEDVLGQVDGVGRVKVLITYKSSSEKVILQDMETDSTTEEEIDGTQSRKSSGKNIREETVYDKTDAGETPYVIKEIEPEIEGVLVAAEGGGNSQTAKNISDAIMALFNIEAHKIKVMKLTDS